MADSGNPLKNQKLTLGFSPCPNDTFIFDALVHHKIDTEGLAFEPVIEDVESLNRKALRGELDISKLSFAACLDVLDTYQVLNAGGALGNGVGPLLVTKNEPSRFLQSRGRGLTVAVPGRHTTAHFLFRIFFPEAEFITEMVFSEIENAVLAGQADAGVLIHEGRFTYANKGLKKIADLGELWESETGLAIPLGGIAVKRNFPEEVKQKVDRVIRRSVEYAFANPRSSEEYVRQYAQEMDEEVRKQHIALYVNKYSLDLGASGRHAVETLFLRAKEAGFSAESQLDIFVNQNVESSS